jgi:hypothetical protein
VTYTYMKKNNIQKLRTPAQHPKKRFSDLNTKHSKIDLYYIRDVIRSQGPIIRDPAYYESYGSLPDAGSTGDGLSQLVWCSIKGSLLS